MRDNLAPSPIIIGRDAHLRELERHLSATQEGTGRVVLIIGEAGMGKTRLVREFVRRVGSRGDIELLEGRCYDEDPPVPYGPFMDALRPFVQERGPEAVVQSAGVWASSLAKLLPELQPLLPGPVVELDAQSEKRRLFEAIHRIVCPKREGDCRIVVLEDIHWSDHASQELILHFARAMVRHRVLILATYRPEESSLAHPPARLISGLRHDRLYREVRLPPLSHGECSCLLEATLGRSLPAGFVDSLHDRTGGNPFFIEEMLASLIEEGTLESLIESARQGKRTDQLGVPISLRDNLLSRTAGLDETTLQVLDYAAVIGRRFDFELLLGLTGLQESQLLRVIELLVDHQLVVEELAPPEDLYTFRHALVRDAVYGEILGRDRRRKHREVLRILEDRYQDKLGDIVDQLAYHSLQARELDRAAGYARLAGDRARSIYAHREAVNHYQVALDLTETDDPRERAQLYEKLGDAAYPLGDTSLYLRYWREAQRLYEQVGLRRKVGGIYRQLGLVFWERGDTQAAFENAHTALEILESQPPDRELAMTYSLLSQLHMLSCHHRESILWGEKAIRLAEHLGDEEVKAHSMNSIGCSMVELGERERGVEYLERSLELARHSGIPSTTIRAYNNLVWVLHGLGEFKRARRIIREGIEFVEEAGWELGIGLLLLAKLAESEMWFGHWGQAAELLDRIIREGELGYPVARLKSIPARSELLQRQGRMDEARQLLDSAMAEYQQHGQFTTLRELTTAVAALCLALDDVDGAVSAMDHCIGILCTKEVPARSDGFLACGVEVYLRAGREAQARELLEALSAAVNRTNTLLGLALLEHTSGLFAAHESRHVHAVGHYGRAISLWQEMGLTYEEAVSRRRRGETLLQVGDPHVRREARHELAAAREIFRRLGAPLDLESVEVLSRRYRLERRPTRVGDDEDVELVGGHHVRSGRETVSTGKAALTERELEVLRLLAQGLSNPEIAVRLTLSNHTVHRHVSNILSKLDLPSRAAAAAYAAERQLL